MGLFDWLPFGNKKSEKTQEELAEIRRMFAARYNNFRLLIQANTRTHELVAEMEEALRGFQPYGMHYVRALCTRISTSVFQMIRHLNELSPGSYDELFTRFDDIQKSILPYVAHRNGTGNGKLIFNLRDVGRDQADICGPKMAMLGEAGSRLGLKIPDGFVITAESFRWFMEKNGLEEEIDRLIQAADSNSNEAMFQVSSKVMQLVIKSTLPEEISKPGLMTHCTQNTGMESSWPYAPVPLARIWKGLPLPGSIVPCSMWIAVLC